jgi:hypothetical protein
VFERTEPNAHLRWCLRHAAFVLVGFASVAVMVLALAWGDPAALCVIPALVLPALLAFRRYPGEGVLAVLRVARNDRRRCVRSSVAPRSRLGADLPRGGLLLARSLAVRPPPSASRAAS